MFLFVVWLFIKNFGLCLILYDSMFFRVFFLYVDVHKKSILSLSAFFSGLTLKNIRNHMALYVNMFLHSMLLMFLLCCLSNVLRTKSRKAYQLLEYFCMILVWELRRWVMHCNWKDLALNFPLKSDLIMRGVRVLFSM